MITRVNIQQKEELLHWKTRVEKVKDYVTENLAGALDASSVAREMKLTPFTLQSVFKKYEGETFRQYVEKVRMEKAFQLLAEGKWVKEVVVATGYKYRATFEKVFKRRYNYPASYFKK